jgi:hypothetical protein
MKVKILVVLAVVTSLFWWFSAWAGRRVPAFQVQKYPSPLAVATLPKSSFPSISSSPVPLAPSKSLVPSPAELPSPFSPAVSPVAAGASALQAKAIPTSNSLVPSTAVNPLAPIPIPSISQPIGPTPVVLQARPLAIDPVTNQILDALMSAVISQESNGDSQVQHPVSKAMGLGQVIPDNIPAWTKETFGQELTAEQFRSSPDAQMYVIRQKLLQYYRQAIAASGGDLHLAVRRVSAQWYSGQPHLYESTNLVATGPSIKDYTIQVLGRFQNFYPQNYLVRY